MANLPGQEEDFDYNYGVPGNVINIARANNPNYFFEIRCPSAGFHLIADMPENINFTVSNAWEPRFSAGLGEINGIGDLGIRIIGENILVDEFARLMWMNTTPIEIPITLLFDAHEDAYRDVYMPMKRLEALAMPDLKGGLLFAPGPSARNPERGKISITLGRSWYFESVVIVSISTAYDVRMSPAGYPISGQAEITFSTAKIMSRQEWSLTQPGRNNNG